MFQYEYSENKEYTVNRMVLNAMGVRPQKGTGNVCRGESSLHHSMWQWGKKPHLQVNTGEGKIDEGGWVATGWGWAILYTWKDTFESNDQG